MAAAENVSNVIRGASPFRISHNRSGNFGWTEPNSGLGEGATRGRTSTDGTTPALGDAATLWLSAGTAGLCCDDRSLKPALRQPRDGGWVQDRSRRG